MYWSRSAFKRSYVALAVSRWGSEKSTTGNFVADLKTRNIIPEKDFYALWAQSYNVILNIDQHRPFTSPRVQEILELVEPEFVCHEISAKNRADKLEKVLVQMKALGRI